MTKNQVPETKNSEVKKEWHLPKIIFLSVFETKVTQTSGSGDAEIFS